jgi:hypothetical protein
MSETDSYPPSAAVSFDSVGGTPQGGFVSTIPFSDNFNSSTGFNNYWTGFSGPPNAGFIALSGNELQLTLNHNSNPLYVGLLTTQALQLTNGSIIFEFAAPGAAATSASGVEVGLGLFSAHETGVPHVTPFTTFLSPWSTDPAGVPNISLVCSSGSLACTYYSGGGSGTDYSATYDPVNHKYGQISVSVSGGIEYAYFSVSPDKSTWAQVCTMNTQNRGGGTMDIAWAALYARSSVNQPSGVTLALADYEYSGVSTPGNPPQAVAAATVTILAPDGTLVASPGNGLPEVVTAAFTPGDSGDYVRQNLVSAIRQAANDPALEVIFHH